jgi:VWFA-related protein
MERRAPAEVHASNNQLPDPKAAFWRNRSGARTYRFLAPILIGVPVFVALAQQTQQTPPSPKISVEVKLVLISATVRDKHEKIVPTLNKNDFVLYLDGHVRAINNFIRQSDLPLTLGLLVQTSLGPRQGYALHNTSDASYAFLDHMLREDKDEAFVVRFGHKVELLQGLTSSRPKLHAALQVMQTTDFSSGGRVDGTPLYDAVCLASNELMKTQGRKALFVLSDGIDRGSKETLEDAVEAAPRADASVYSILVAENWPGPNGKKVLERISTETGGHMFKIFHGLTVAQIYAQAGEELRNEYLLGCTPTPADTGAGYHRIHLTTKQKGLTVQPRDGYYSDQ